MHAVALQKAYEYSLNAVTRGGKNINGWVSGSALVGYSFGLGLVHGQAQPQPFCGSGARRRTIGIRDCTTP